ncbi:prolipoprotein diacylglyceryl transferase [Candidatus Woesearchaeota archaeon]|nr:prolipoprotein diacylglyceryl transferase [Candidatus Woesearchaeota archaeon]
MFEHNLSPFIFEINGFGIRWYSLVYIFGFLLSIYFLKKYKNSLKIQDEEIYDFITYLILGVVIGARLFEVLVWEPRYYFNNLAEIVKVWHGGMSFHGGLIGAVLATYIYCRKKKFDFWIFADLLTIPAALALAFGRIANFVNAELIGTVSNSNWCVVYQNSDGCRHPSQLYAAAYRFVLFFYLVFMNKKKFKAGFLFWNFIFLESIGRFTVDFYREDRLYSGLSIGQWSSIILIAISLIFFIKRYKEDLKKLFGKG